MIRRYEHSDRTREATMNSIKKFFDAANQSAEAVNREIIDTTQRNLNLGLDLAKSLAGARNPSEIVKLQASFWLKQFNEFTAQAEEVRKRLFGFTAEHKAAEPTPEPGLGEPAGESPTPPQQEHSPAAQDPANARPKQKPAKQKLETPPLAAQTAKTAESEVGRPKPRLQRSTAEKRSTRPRSTSRDPARKQGERKPRATRTPTGQVTRTPMGVKFGMLDGNAVRFTTFEAWWLVDGAWRPISPGEVLSNAAVMREARFKEVFPQVPILPRKAFQSDNR